jgi:hypothetical protein
MTNVKLSDESIERMLEQVKVDFARNTLKESYPVAATVHELVDIDVKKDDVGLGYLCIICDTV